MFRRIVIAVIICLLSLGGLTAHRDIIDLQQQVRLLSRPKIELVDVIANVSPHVVKITTDYWTGSGVIIDPHTVLTAGHIISDAELFTIETSDGQKYEAFDWMCGPDADYGFLFFYENLGIGVICGDSDKLRIGDPIFTLGSPCGIRGTASYGIVANLNILNSYFGEQPLILTDAIGNPGLSGGPIFNMKGELIGIIVGTYSWFGNGTIVVPANSCTLIEL